MQKVNDRHMILIDLIFEHLRSDNKYLASRSYEWLKEIGALRDGSLSLLDFYNRNCSNMYLPFAVLQSAKMRHVRLKNAILEWCNFRDAYLPASFLENANFNHACLQHASLQEADLELANLAYTDLRGANFERANLRGAVLTEARFSYNTILPDGSNWTVESDIAQFTDPNHPNFRSDITAEVRWGSSWY